MTKGNYTLLFYYDTDGNVTSFKYGDTMYYYVKNLQGDVVKIINQSGTVFASYVYDAWGNIKSVTGDPNLRELNPFRYRGYVYDSESGLYYLQSRYYDPFTGRFLNADVYFDTESGTPLSTNMFAYCENNAIFASDPTGYWNSTDHVNLCKKAGFAKTVQNWVTYADSKFSSDSKYSAPFHSRSSNPNAVNIAKYLYNKSINIIKQYKNGKTKSLTFEYCQHAKIKKDTNSKVYLDDYYLGFIAKSGSNKGKKITTNEKAKKLLYELNKLGNRGLQSYALLGLSLHIVQDYFAHLTKIDVYKSNKKYFTGTTTSFSNNILKNTKKFEDNN